MQITLTTAAAERARRFLSENPAAVGLRFGVRRTGCSGWGYVIDLAQHADADDHVEEVDGVRILIDPASLPLVQGTAIDFERKGLNAQFVFRNPNADAECGCGESFTTQVA